MRDAAGELTQRIQLLRLRQRRLGTLALLCLGGEARIGLRQCLRAFLDAAFQRAGKLEKLSFGAVAVTLTLRQREGQRVECLPEPA